MRMRSIAVENFRDLPDTTFRHQSRHAGEVCPGGFRWFLFKIPCPRQRFAKHWKGPGPCRAVVVSGLAPGVLVAFIPAPVRFQRIIQEPAVISVNWQWRGDTQWRQSPKRAGDDQVPSCGLDAFSCALLPDDSKAGQEQTIAAQCICLLYTSDAAD